MTANMGVARNMATGALAAGAVEPTAGVSHGHGAAGTLCLNCGTRLIGEHCHACGQTGHVHRTVGAIGHELAHGVFHFEGKTWRTLPLLIFRPGELTRRYIAGERARFVSPLALFLFTVFLMFATISAMTPSDFMSSGMTGTEKALVEMQDKVRNDLDQLERGRTVAVAAGQPTAELDGQIAKLKKDIG